jgi:hypothetical protein
MESNFELFRTRLSSWEKGFRLLKEALANKRRSKRKQEDERANSHRA